MPKGSENAVKVARAYTHRPAIVCFEDAFHGRTLLGLALTSKTHPYKLGFGPFPSEVYRIPYAYCYRCSYGKSYPSCHIRCGMQAFQEFFSRVVAAESVAAIIVEPVLGEGGFVVPPQEFVTELRATCDKYGIVLIADEVQTGFARTGAMFACERFGLEPDILVTAKSMGGGLPIAAITGRAELMDAAVPGGLGGTFRAIQSHVLPRWRSSRPSTNKISVIVPINWANTFNVGRGNGIAVGPWSAMFAD